MKFKALILETTFVVISDTACKAVMEKYGELELRWETIDVPDGEDPDRVAERIMHTRAMLKQAPLSIAIDLSPHANSPVY